MVKVVHLTGFQRKFAEVEVLDRFLFEPRRTVVTLHGDALLHYEYALVVEEHFSGSTIRIERPSAADLDPLIVRARAAFERAIAEVLREHAAGISNVEGDVERYLRPGREVVTQLKPFGGMP